MLLPGTRLGPYTILDLVAVGGMGEVYRAEDSRLRRDVAIKVLPEHLAGDKQSLERFRRECRAVAALSHPNILAIFDFGNENGVLYAVTELLEGETLRTRFGSGALTAEEAITIMLSIADGVAAAHARGIVHRDLKPENIFLTRDGRVKVLDFGLARPASGVFAHRGEHIATEILPTEPGVVIGTIGYIAPEQVEAREQTPATDVFALGCMFYEMLTGRVPFDRASSAHSLVALLHDETPRLEDPELDAVIHKCLQKDPRERFSDAGELAQHLRELRLPPEQRITRRERVVAKPRMRWIVFLALLALIGSVATWLALRDHQLDNGYDLRASDIRGDAETIRLIELALHADAEGNRPKAIELLTEAWRRGPKTPIPAAFLSSFIEAKGDQPRARYWEAEAMKRMEGASPYESLLTRYLAESSQNALQELALAKSALDLRPNAWRLRLAAAHIYLGQRDREAARRELQQIDVSKPDDRRLMLVLADRASLGDVDGAARDLHRSPLVKRPAFFFYTQARIAWSRGDARRAAILYDRAASIAADEGLGAMEAEARELAGIAYLRMGGWEEARQRFTSSAARGRSIDIEYRIYASSALGAYAAWRAGDLDERDRKLMDAYAVGPPAEPLASLRLLAIRTRSNVWRNWTVAPIAKEPILAPTMSLIRAREAWAAGDLDTARRELRRARAEGIDLREAREEAELLAAELGMPSQWLPPDPPYPNILRYLAVFDYPSRAQPEISIGTGVAR